MKNIVVAIDLGDFSKRIIEFAVEFVTSYPARLHFLHIVSTDVPSAIGDLSVQYVHEIEENIIKLKKERLNEITAFIKEKGISYEVDVVEGVASNEILEKAKEVHAQMIIIGSHGHGAFYEALIGSVAHDVLKKTGTPMLIVPDKYRNK